MDLEPTTKKSSSFLSDISPEQRLELQQQTALEFGIPPFFHDTLKNGNKGPELSVIPSGMFEMGSTPKEFGHTIEEAPQHYVNIRTPFAMGRCTITAEEFDEFREATHWHLRPDLLWTKGKKPVANIRISDAKLYIKWLNQQTGQTYRLPTEAEWEYAARAGSTTPFYFGENVSCKEVNFDPTSPYNEKKQQKSWFLPRCVPWPFSMEVGSKPPNLWGLHDIHGNIWEFTDSPWTNSHIGAHRDGSASISNHSQWHTTKGGSWFDAAEKSRSAARMKRFFDELDTNLGFRVVREL